jgi:hypothetical protein
MNTVHQHLGLGVLPDQPIVGYLARSLSAFYALFGGLLWVLSFRVAASRTVLLYISASTAAFGVLLLGIDFAEGLPAYWRVFEGPVVILYGVVLWILSVKPLGSHLNN